MPSPDIKFEIGHVYMLLFAILVFALILARAIAELWLSRLNERHVRAHADEVPPAFREDS